MSSTSSCEVLVIGAGPAGSAAAITLAKTGHRVVIADQRTFPRDKVCGDGLISDALGALERLGVSDDVRREAWTGDELRVYAPSGAHIALHGAFACLPRERLDTILLDAARRAGAMVVKGTAVAPILDSTRVVGANFRTEQGPREVRGQLTILATGANATALEAFGLQAARKPTAVAGRAYYETTADVASEYSRLVIAYQRQWCPGYAWIFPAPGNRFNVGVGLFGDSAEHGRVHGFFDHFCRTFPAAAGLIAASRCIRPFRGAPIRSGLGQAAFGRLGLLAAGETVATTYAATGEGIGKAMESGMLSAEFASDVLRGERPAYGLEHAYRQEFERRFSKRYLAYDVAQRWARRPWMLNLLAQRATAGRFVQSELEALIAERGDASNLFSTAGLLKSLIG